MDGETAPPPVDPALLRGLTQQRISRRDLLRSAGVGAGGLALASFLAACSATSSTKKISAGFDWSAQKKAGILNFANWPLYIDKAKDAQGNLIHPSLDRFTKATGITVDYREVINDYASFFGKLQPELSTGQPTGWDLIVFEFPKWLPMMIRLGYLIPLDQSYLVNFNKYAGPKYQDRSYDPGNKYSVPYQSGITGIGYDPALTGREITSVMDLFDPAFKGRVGMFGDTEDTPNFTLLGLGVEPETSTPADWKRAGDLLTKQRGEGIVRQYFGQNYIGALQRGDVALTMAWSADVLQSQLGGFPNLKFVIPDEGGLLWTDNLCIPIGAQHPVDAITFMDFIYRPEIAAMIVGWIENVSPVPAAQEVLRKQGSEVAGNPLVFPTPGMYAKLHGYRTLSQKEEQVWNGIFLPIYQS